MLKILMSLLSNKVISDFKNSAEINNNSIGNTTLEIDSSIKKKIKKISSILSIAFTFFYVFSFFLMDSITALIVISLIYILFICLCLSLANKSLTVFKIQEDKIYKSNFFEKNKFICELKEIKSYCELGSEIGVINQENKIIFTFSIYCNNSEFIKFLEKRSGLSIFSRGIDPLAYISLSLAFLCSFLPFLRTNSMFDTIFSIGIILFFLLWGINEKIKYINVTQNLITIKTIFGTKTYKYSQFNKIIYQKNSDDVLVILWKIRAYSNKKLVFTFNHINDLAFQKIMKQFFNNNIETREKRKTFMK